MLRALIARAAQSSASQAGSSKERSSATAAASRPTTGHSQNARSPRCQISQDLEAAFMVLLD